jgi:hypothetical protein
MKLRHAAALALASWYLMVPPYRACTDCSRRTLQPDSINSSLDKWEVVESFGTAASCRASLDSYVKREQIWKGHGLAGNRYVAAFGRCLAADDPGLKRKYGRLPRILPRIPVTEKTARYGLEVMGLYVLPDSIR